MQIGIAGIGRMGEAMGLRLMEQGHGLTVWNRSPGRTAALEKAGAAVAASPTELVSRVETVITILTDAAAIDSVYHGAGGLLSGDVAGKLIIEMSTVLPETEIALAPKVRAKGAAFVECPVSGSTGPARQGQLIGVMGGEAADIARARPVLEALCRRIEHVGDVGAGSTMKLAINLPLMVYWQALGEALAMCRHLEIDPAELIDFLTETSGAANVLKQRGGIIAAKLKGEPPSPVTFDVDGGIKDLKAMLEEGKRRGIDLPLVERTLACYEEAKTKLSGADELTFVTAYWATRGKT